MNKELMGQDFESSERSERETTLMRHDVNDANQRIIMQIETD